MAITSFKKDLWMTMILEDYEGLSLADVITNKPDYMDGAKCVYNTADLTTGLQDYTGTVTYEGVNTVAKNLVFDKQKYFAFQVDDVDRIQAAGDLMQPVTKKMARAMKSQIDEDVLAEAVAGAGAKIGSSSAKEQVADAAQAYEYIVDLGTLLDEKDVPMDERFVIAAPEFVNLLAKDVRVVDNTKVLENGVVQGMEINGMQVLKSNNLPAGCVVALHKTAVGYGKQLERVEPMRLENSFSDAVRGLVSYGAKTLIPNGVAVLYYAIA